MSTLKKISLFVIMAAVVVAFMSPAAMARTGRGGEPIECPANAEFQPPHYSGKITVIWDKGDVYISGFVRQSRDCYGHMSTVEPYLLTSEMPLEEFQSMTANDLKGLCFQDLANNGSFNCISEGIIQIIKAYGIRRTSETSFTVNVVLMQEIVTGE